MKRILIITGCLLICLFITGRFLDARYKKFWHPVFDKLDIATKDSSRYDGIFLGDSRVHFGINPYYVDSVTKLQTYNMGMGGASVNEINFLTRLWFNSHPAPAFTVISMSYVDILEPDRNFRNPCYYFYYLDNDIVNKELSTWHYHTNLFKVLSVLKYTAFDDFNKTTILRNIQGETAVKPGGVVYHGFFNNAYNGFNNSFEPNDVKPTAEWKKGVTGFEAIVRFIQQHHSQPILVYPPGTNHISHIPKIALFNTIDSAITQFAVTNNIPLLRYDNDTTYTSNLFSDEWHVNIKGSIKYSTQLGEDIKRIMKDR